jgi:hypothetical protein
MGWFTITLDIIFKMIGFLIPMTLFLIDI